MRKNGFLAFCFAFIPGAGQMYLGYTKRGVSIMGAFALTIVLMVMFAFPYLSALLPVIWFYAFFDTFNLRAQMLDNHYVEDKFLFNTNWLVSESWKKIFDKRHYIMGGCFIFFGVFLIYKSFIEGFVRAYLPRVTVDFLNGMPTLILAVAIIAFGVFLIKGKSEEKPKQIEDLKQFGGDNNE